MIGKVAFSHPIYRPHPTGAARSVGVSVSKAVSTNNQDEDARSSRSGSSPFYRGSRASGVPEADHLLISLDQIPGVVG